MFGKIKEKYIKDGIAEYAKRLSKYTNLELIEVMEENFIDNPKTEEIIIIMDKEKNNIKKHISDKDFLICLDRKGKELNSIQFAEKIENITIDRTFNNYICHRWFIWNI